MFRKTAGNRTNPVKEETVYYFVIMETSAQTYKTRIVHLIFNTRPHRSKRNAPQMQGVLRLLTTC